MADKQTNLATNFPNFINVLNTIQGGLPDVHIGVVIIGHGHQGRRRARRPGIGTVGNGGCSGTGEGGNLQLFGAPVTGTFISDIKQTDGTRASRTTPATSTTCSARWRSVGAGGCGFEQHLEAMKRALEQQPGERRASSAPTPSSP